MFWISISEYGHLKSIALVCTCSWTYKRTFYINFFFLFNKKRNYSLGFVCMFSKPEWGACECNCIVIQYNLCISHSNLGCIEFDWYIHYHVFEENKWNVIYIYIYITQESSISFTWSCCYKNSVCNCFLFFQGSFFFLFTLKALGLI